MDGSRSGSRLSVRLAALALLVVLATGCGERPRWIEIDDARALYDGTRGDTVGSLLVDGNEVASCTRPWQLPEVVCEVDQAVIMTNTFDLELALDIGTVSRAVDLRTLHAGRNLIVLEGEGPLLIAAVTFEVRFESYVPWSAAVAIAILLGLGAAFALYLLLRARLLSGDGAKPRGIAITCARIATALALVGVLPISHYARTIEPVIVAIPTLLGTFAAAAIVIDAIGKRRLGGYRVGLLLNAVFAAALLPLIIGFAAMSLKAKAIVVGVMLLLLLGH